MTIKITPSLIKALRSLRGHECSVCGKPLSIQDSRDMVLGCSEWNDGQPDALERHYRASRTYSPVSSPDVIVMAFIELLGDLPEKVDAERQAHKVFNESDGCREQEAAYWKVKSSCAAARDAFIDRLFAAQEVEEKEER